MIAWLLWLVVAQASDSWGDWLADAEARDGWVHSAETLEQRRAALCATQELPPCAENVAWEPCEAGGTEECLVAAWAHLERGNVSAAAWSWREACAAGVTRACVDLIK